MIKHQNAAPARESRIHQLGDGLHPLPVYTIEPGAIVPLSSSSSIMLLFTIWAQRKGFDAVSIYNKARPDNQMLRPDRLLAFLPWTVIPESIEATLLLDDLAAIKEHQLCELIPQIESGDYEPEPAYTHWVVTEDGRIAGEARELDPTKFPDEQGQHFCYVRLFGMPDCAEYGYTSASNLRAKHESIGGPKSSPTTG